MAWRRRTRFGVLAVLTGLAALLAWNGVAPREALGWTEVAIEDLADRARGRIEAALAIEGRSSTVTDTPQPILAAPDVSGGQGAVSASPVWPTAINLNAPLDPEPAGAYRRLTDGGCCAGAWWSTDGSRAYFLARPEGQPSAGIYETDVWPPGLPPKPAAMDLARGAGAARFTVRSAEGHSIVTDHNTAKTWQVATGGSPAHVAADGTSVVWWKARGDRGHFDAAITVYASDLDNTPARELVTLWGASVVGYLAGEQRVLINGRPVQDRADFVLATVHAITGELGQLAKGTWLSNAVPSPSGEWVAYMVSLDAQNPTANGLWLVGTHNEAPRLLPFIGAYRWRDGDTLIYMPQIAGAVSDEIWELDAPTLRTSRLVNPIAVPIRVANNDWSVAPGGRHLLFRSAADFNLWLVRLP